ncbi:MAG: hypothetical protein IPM83_16625 [Ignavibacteria bacterium]|nr:hypothetical protein [Ignavibacteria bacterium]
MDRLARKWETAKALSMRRNVCQEKNTHRDGVMFFSTRQPIVRKRRSTSFKRKVTTSMPYA